MFVDSDGGALLHFVDLLLPLPEDLVVDFACTNEVLDRWQRVIVR